MSFRIQVETEGGTATIRPVGDVDLTTEPCVRKAIAAAFDDVGTRRLVVDLSDVTFLDCRGLSALVEGRQRADERGVSYRVVGARGIAGTLLCLTGTTDYLSGGVG
ncbi:STAS domain-containing protein [Rugosimonospora africana]|uniref:Anti-sigma factor antagonist n=1 Tax=Rugosimonospora africana TaxID=556532 RepID=A0A8J3R1C5_9ACTN|nr:STAS domain-containing protein [Rugosimonospora africana]GIH20401.1 hypothetical protein Raf01_85730 [Rugosimonospora africana]